MRRKQAYLHLNNRLNLLELLCGLLILSLMIIFPNLYQPPSVGNKLLLCPLSSAQKCLSPHFVALANTCVPEDLMWLPWWPSIELLCFLTDAHTC